MTGEGAWELFKELIRIDTSNPPGNEKPACEVLARYLNQTSGGRLWVRVLEAAPGRANLVARVPAGDPGHGPVLLAAHLDVVPASEKGWRHSPFGGVEEDGVLYGRGALDMKSMAAMCAAVMGVAAGQSLKRPLIFAAVADEESGCALGSRFLVERHPDLVRADYMLGEGGGFTQYFGGVRFCPIGTAEKGQIGLRIFFRGAGGHASMAPGSNPAFRLAETLRRLRLARPRIHLCEPARVFLRELGRLQPGPLGWALRRLEKFPGIFIRLFSKQWAPLLPFLANTVSPTRLSGSRALNVIPEEVACDLDVRLLPEQTLEGFLNELWGILGEELEHEVLFYEKPVVSSIATPLYRHLEQAVLGCDCGARPAPFLIPGYTDARFFHRLGAQCYGFAPLVMEREEAEAFRLRLHGTDEQVSKNAFLKGCRLLERTVLSFVS